jgi:hypothetical protein
VEGLIEQMYVSPLSTKYVTPKKRRVKSPVAPPSVDYAFYDAYHARLVGLALMSTRACPRWTWSAGLSGQSSGEW